MYQTNGLHFFFSNIRERSTGNSIFTVLILLVHFSEQFSIKILFQSSLFSMIPLIDDICDLLFLSCFSR